MNIKEFIKALDHITEEKGISKDVVFDSMELSLATAYKKNFGSKTNVEVKIDRETGSIKVFAYYVVVDDIDFGSETTDEDGNIVKIPPEINLDAQVTLDDAKELDPEAKVGDTIYKEITPDDFGRLAASTAKQVLTQKMREAEKNLIAADEALQTTTINSIKQLKEWRDNVNASIFDTLDKAMSGGLGLDLLEEEWKLIDDYSSKYYDNVERYLNMEEYTNELNEAANAIGLSAENQQKLNAFRDKELKQLKEKEKLTEYDIAESRARLEIM